MIAHPLFDFERAGTLPKSPNDLVFGRCELNTAIELNRRWHSVFPDISASNCYRNKVCIAYAAIFDGVYFASAIVTSPIAANRLKGGGSLVELRRLAIEKQAPKNTATKFLSYIVKDLKRREPDLVAIISYQNKDTHLGTIYKAGNWYVDSQSKFVDWSTKKRWRSLPQTTSNKVRWRFNLKRNIENESSI